MSLFSSPAKTFRAGMLGLALASGGCAYVNFSRPMSEQEILARQEVRSYYTALQQAFAMGSPEALTRLFSPAITHPMSYSEIEAWSRKFFAEHQRARFVIQKLDIEEIGPVQAVVLLVYKVETPDGRGSFGGTERDTLVQHRGHWYTAAWDKLSP